MHRAELPLLRILGQATLEHPFHEHGNPVRILARDGNLILSQTDPSQLAGTVAVHHHDDPGPGDDGIFYWTGKGLTGMRTATIHRRQALWPTPRIPVHRTRTATTLGIAAINYYEWCQDHKQAAPGVSVRRCSGWRPGDTAGSKPLLRTAPGTAAVPISGPMQTVRAVGATGTTPPSGTIANFTDWRGGILRSCGTPTTSARSRPTTFFRAACLMMMLVDSREFVIDESN